jgi:hypothetical protein
MAVSLHYLDGRLPPRARRRAPGSITPSLLRKIHQAAQHSVGLRIDVAAICEAKMLVERIMAVNEDLDHVIMAQIKTNRQQLPAYRLLLELWC